ncbi:MAG: hypothetical protein CMC05_15960 [Flavobacteriaceae bacterium]|jgi:hypothetical protein|nr:hypothetical protein [Flavobacteriaceae bacterium]MBD09382.1 hypothetical protein [Flavobacteriaceae bacterium]|tara:strand:+ start:16104 stop:16907 length:804 start_codon:yes stop_codon:yes gene_type:complete
MRKVFLIIVFACFIASCNVTESIVFNQDGSGEFLATYEMGEAIKAMSVAMGGDENKEKKEGGEIMDTTIVFADIMETYKDSVAALPEEKRLAMEAVKDMYMRMQINEDEGVMSFGMGMQFESIDDLKDIRKKLKKIQSLNSQGDQVNAMKENSPLGNFMGNENNDVAYIYTTDGFSRMTSIKLPDEATEDAIDELFDETDESNQQFLEYFEGSFYNVKLTFPKAVKSIDVEGAEFSDDRKTVTYKTNWVEYLKNPKLLDVNVKFVDE